VTAIDANTDLAIGCRRDAHVATACAPDLDMGSGNHVGTRAGCSLTKRRVKPYAIEMQAGAVHIENKSWMRRASDPHAAALAQHGR